MEYYTAQRRLSPRAWNFKVQKGDCRHTRAWTTTATAAGALAAGRALLAPLALAAVAALTAGASLSP